MISLSFCDNIQFIYSIYFLHSTGDVKRNPGTVPKDGTGPSPPFTDVMCFCCYALLFDNVCNLRLIKRRFIWDNRIVRFRWPLFQKLIAENLVPSLNVLIAYVSEIVRMATSFHSLTPPTPPPFSEIGAGAVVGRWYDTIFRVTSLIDPCNITHIYKMWFNDRVWFWKTIREWDRVCFMKFLLSGWAVVQLALFLLRDTPYSCAV